MAPPSSLASAATLSTINYTCKAFLNLTTQSYVVRGRNYLLDALAGQGSLDKGVRIEQGEAIVRKEGGEGVIAHGRVIGDGDVLGEESLPRRGIITGESGRKWARW